MATLTSRNPYTWETNATFETFSDEKVVSLLDTAHDAYREWKEMSIIDKKQLFFRLAEELEDNIDTLAKLETQEMGRLYHVAKAWLKQTVDLITRYTNKVELILADEAFDHGWLRGHYQYDSLGVIYGIAPWNFPFHQLLRAAVPNLLAWNTVVYKHASNVPMCAAAIEKLFIDAGFPEGVYTNLFIQSSQSELIISHPHVQWVNITGGEVAGSAVWALAGKHLKRSILELWGNDAFLILDHADMDKMVAHAVACRISNGGQRCNGSKRFVVLEKHYDAFVEKFGQAMSELRVGDPMDKETELPPLSGSKLVQEIHTQVTKTIAEWARLVTGGEILDQESNLYAPTVLVDVTPEMTSYKEEVFGPVASVIKSSSVDESIAIANNNAFGLSAAVFGDDIEECERVAKRLEWWMIFINRQPWSKASLPFWGVKKSGYGKENGAEWLRAFTNKKVVLY